MMQLSSLLLQRCYITQECGIITFYFQGTISVLIVNEEVLIIMNTGFSTFQSSSSDLQARLRIAIRKTHVSSSCCYICRVVPSLTCPCSSTTLTPNLKPNPRFIIIKKRQISCSFLLILKSYSFNVGLFITQWALNKVRSVKVTH